MLADLDTGVSACPARDRLYRGSERNKGIHIQTAESSVSCDLCIDIKILDDQVESIVA